MAQLLNLPTIDSNKFLVIDEGAHANYAENLVIAWLQTIRKKGIQHSVHILSFSNPKSHLEKSLKSLNLSNIEVQDYFSIDPQDEEPDIHSKIIDFAQKHSSSILVIDCLSTLALQIGIAKACRFVERLYQNHKSLVFCIYKRDLHLNIPRIETLGNIYIKIRKSKKLAFESNIHYEVYILHKKPGGSVQNWSELVQQNIENYDLQSEKILENLTKDQNKSPEVSIKPEATFRIEINKREQQQRDSVQLPYILPGNPGSDSKIIYIPDDVDDLDEEDPDDDLDI